MARILLGVSGGICRLQGGRAGTPRDEGRSRGAGDPDPVEPRVRRAARPSRASPARRCSSRSSSATRRGAPIRASSRPTTTRSATSSWPRGVTPSASRRPPRTRSRRWPPARPTTCVTTAYLACASPVLVAPAMNNHMYEHPATQANLNLLRDRGVHVIEPGTGPLASRGEWGVGRLAEPRRSSRRSRWSPGGAPRPARRDARAGHGRRHARAARLRCASSATARAAGWASRWPRRPPAGARP